MSTPAQTPDLSDFKPDTSDFTPDHDLSDFTADAPATQAAPQQAYRQATAAGPFAPAGAAEEAIGANAGLKDSGRAVALGAAYAAPAMFAPATILGRMALTGGASGVQTALTGGSLKQSLEAGASGAVLQGAGEKLLGMLPSVLRGQATKNFQAATKANPLPINVNPAGSVGMDVQDLANSGGQMPKVVRDFLKRATDPTRGPMTFEEARKFYSNASRLSADEFGRLTPAMQRQVALFTKALGGSLQETAASAGVGNQYSDALKQYAGASRMDNRIESVLDFIKKTSPYIAAGYGAKKVYEGNR